MRELHQLRDESRDLGFGVGLQLLASRLFGRAPLHRLILPGYRFPVYYRPRSSDVLVLRQVLGGREYGCIGSEPNVTSMLDLGGNIGAASFYLLLRHPNAKVVFVEPDAGNLAVARKTLAPFGERVAFVQSGIWDRAAKLTVERGAYREGGEWAYRVRPATPGEVGDLVGVTIESLLKQRGWASVDLVKMDIEGAEAVAFRGATAPAWLPLVRTLAVELHGRDCDAALTAAYADIPHVRSLHGETTVMRRAAEATS